MKSAVQIEWYENICKKFLEPRQQLSGVPYTPADMNDCMGVIDKYAKNLRDKQEDLCTIFNLHQINYDNNFLNHYSSKYLLEIGGTELLNLVLGDNITDFSSSQDVV